MATELQIQEVFSNRSDVLTMVACDGEVYHVTGNATGYLVVTPPLIEDETGRVRERDGWVKFANQIRFHFEGGELDGKCRSTVIVDGRWLHTEDQYVGTTTPTNNAINYFVRTHGGEPKQRLVIPADDGPHELEYVIRCRNVSIELQDTYPDEPPGIAIHVDVYCKATDTVTDE